jgi:uncharacterized membrane protein
VQPVDEDLEALAGLRLDERAPVDRTELLVELGKLACKHVDERADDAAGREFVEARVYGIAGLDQRRCAAGPGSAPFGELP